MLASHFTKPLEGEAFYQFRVEMMNLDLGLTSADLAWDHLAANEPIPQECVEESDPS